MRPPLGSTSVEGALVVLKIAFLVLLYLFIWRIVRTASRELRLPQDTMMLSASASGLNVSTPKVGRLIVQESPTLDDGQELELNSRALTIGRSRQNDVALEDDEYASSRHARIEPRVDGVWVNDVGSTNGTFVNGAQIDRPRRLAAGDIVRIGSTDLRFEP